MHMRFPVRNVCSGCYNIIYNSVPLCLPEAAGGKGRRPADIRLQFLQETREEVSQILRLFEEASAGKAVRREDLPEHTKGHYKRGVE